MKFQEINKKYFLGVMILGIFITHLYLNLIRLNLQVSQIFFWGSLFVSASCLAYLALTLKENEENLFLIALILMAVSNLLLFTSRFDLPFGADIWGEYGVAQHTYEINNWEVTSNQYSAMLSISILPTVIAKITGVDSLFIFRFIMPSLGALMVLFLYFFLKNIFNYRLASLASILFVLDLIYLHQFPQLLRQNIAFLFFFMILYTFSLKRAISSVILSLLAGIGVIISHYTVSYFMILFFILAIFTSIFLKKYSPQINKNLISSKDYFIAYFIKDSKKIKLSYLIIILFSLTLVWAFFVNTYTTSLHISYIPDTVYRELSQLSDLQNQKQMEEADLIISNLSVLLTSYHSGEISFAELESKLNQQNINLSDYNSKENISLDTISSILLNETISQNKFGELVGNNYRAPHNFHYYTKYLFKSKQGGYFTASFNLIQRICIILGLILLVFSFKSRSQLIVVLYGCAILGLIGLSFIISNFSIALDLGRTYSFGLLAFTTFSASLFLFVLSKYSYSPKLVILIILILSFSFNSNLYQFPSILWDKGTTTSLNRVSPLSLEEYYTIEWIKSQDNKSIFLLSNWKDKTFCISLGLICKSSLKSDIFQEAYMMHFNNESYLEDKDLCYNSKFVRINGLV